MSTCSSRVFLVATAMLLMLQSVLAYCETLTIQVVGKDGQAVIDAVVYAKTTDKIESESIENPTPVIDQVDKEFVKYVTPVYVGSAVTFPNHDKIRHHVYSFSPAKTFEIPLYLDMPRNPVIFDKEGPVSLGCNIHDWMSAYVFVLSTPHFGKTGDFGKTEIILPPGDYNLFVWHPRLSGKPDAYSKHLLVETGTDTEAKIVVNLRKVFKVRRGPKSSRTSFGGYR